MTNTPETRWVQHISGQGNKWEVDPTCPYDDCWSVLRSDKPGNHHFLPLHEYRLCPPPEVWKEVTDEVGIGQVIAHSFSGSAVWNVSLKCPDPAGLYRLRKVQLMEPSSTGGAFRWAFIIEQKVQP